MNSDVAPFDTPRDFTKAVEEAVENALSNRGLLRLRKWCFVSPINDEFDVFVGLNRNFKYSSIADVDVIPCWGIHSRLIQKLTSEWNGERYKRGEVCTAPVELDGIVQPQSFRFLASSELQTVADALSDYYADQVIPALKPYGSYKAIIPCLEALEDAWGGWDQSLLLAYKMAGWDEKADAYVESRQRKCDANPAYAAYYAPFLAQYGQHFDAV